MKVKFLIKYGDNSDNDEINVKITDVNTAGMNIENILKEIKQKIILTLQK